MMNVVTDSKGCVGCGACVDVCGCGALQLRKGAEGFYTPELNEGACVDCSRCTRVCPMFVRRTGKRDDAAFCYGWNEDAETRRYSTSGGAFKAIADAVLDDGGLVIGARYADDWSRVEAASTDQCGLEPLQRTKYCQCYPSDLYAEIQGALAENRLVMAVVTPCSAAALRNRFCDPDNLLIVDFFCGGVIPEKALSDYTAYLKSKYRSDIKELNMRDKSKSWEQPCMRVAFENGATYLKGHRFDPYLYYYYSPYLKNKPCLDCAFTDHSCADLTLGDFWGYRKEKIENDGQGMSLVCAYTDLGKRFIDRPTLAMKLHPLTEKEVSYAFKEKSFTRENRALRDQYIKELGTCDFTELAKRHAFKGGVVGIVAKRIKKKLFKT